MITQIDLLSWGLASLWGIGLGIFYFGGLWWTLRILPGKSNARLLLGLSFVLRALIALLGFYIIIQRGVYGFFFTIGGFFLIRFIMTRMLGPAERNTRDANQSR